MITANQIAYWSHLETVRANKAREEETVRSNVTKEAETERSNKAKEAETQRSNQASEDIKALGPAGWAVNRGVQGIQSIPSIFKTNSSNTVEENRNTTRGR